MGHLDRYRVLDCFISQTNLEQATRTVLGKIESREGGYVCFSNVHTVVTARSDLRLRHIINHSFLSVPDGKPLSIVAKLGGIAGVDQVAGPDFMPHFMQAAVGARHFLYGSTPHTLEQLLKTLRERFPGAVFVGSYSPAFHKVPEAEMQEIISGINRTKPDIVWVGLGAPKQEYWMADHWESLKPAILMGVGAAFDFHAGTQPRAPAWVRTLCAEWLYRLCQEPRRLWKRYLVTNFLFFYYLCQETLFSKH